MKFWLCLVLVLPPVCVADPGSRIDPRAVVTLDKATTAYKNFKSLTVNGYSIIVRRGVTIYVKSTLSVQRHKRFAFREDVLDEKGRVLFPGKAVLYDANNCSIWGEEDGVDVTPVNEIDNPANRHFKFGWILTTGFEFFRPLVDGTNNIVSVKGTTVRYRRVKSEQGEVEQVVLRKAEENVKGVPTVTLSFDARSSFLRSLQVEGSSDSILEKFSVPTESWRGSQKDTDAQTYNWQIVSRGISQAKPPK